MKVNLNEGYYVIAEQGGYRKHSQPYAVDKTTRNTDLVSKQDSNLGPGQYDIEQIRSLS